MCEGIRVKITKNVMKREMRMNGNVRRKVSEFGELEEDSIW